MKLSDEVLAGKHDARHKHKLGTANRFLSEAIAKLEQELAECNRTKNDYCTADCMRRCYNYAGALADAKHFEEENQRLKADLNKITQSYQAGLLVRDQLKEQLRVRGEEYSDLIMQVANKFPNESRHETAKRYITQTENRSNNCEAKTDDGKCNDDG